MDGRVSLLRSADLKVPQDYRETLQRGDRVVGCQNLIRIWDSGEWQTRTAECRRRAANPLPGKQRIDGDIEGSNGTPVGAPVASGLAQTAQGVNVSRHGWNNGTPQPRDGSRKSYKTNGVVPPAGLEPATRGLGNRCSIRLSYGGTRTWIQGVAHSRGLPLSHPMIPHPRADRLV